MNIFKKEKRAILGLSLGHFSIDLYAALLVPLYPIITTKLGMNLASISAIIAFGHLVSSMLQPLFGFVSDKLKHRIFMIWGLVFTSIFIPLATKAPSIILFLTCLLIGMLGNAFFHPQVSSLVKDFNKNNPDLNYDMGIFLGLGTIGYAIGPYISTYTYQNYGENKFLYLCLLGLITAIFIYFYVPKKPAKKQENKGNFFKIMYEILKNKTCLFLTFISTIKSAVSISFGTYIPFLLKNQGFSLDTTGIIVTLFFISGGLATIFSSKIENKIGANGVVVLSFTTILPLILGFLYSLNYNKILACTLFILTGFFILLSVGVILVKAQNAVPQHTGVVSGVMQGFSWGLGALFLAPLGVIGQNFGIDKILILMALIAFMVGIFTIKNPNFLK